MSAAISPIPTRPRSATAPASSPRDAGSMDQLAIVSLTELTERLRIARRGRLFDGRGLRLGDLLVGHSLVTAAEIADAMTTQRLTRKRLGEILIEHGLISTEALCLVLSEQFGLPIVDLERFPIQPEARESLPAEVCLQRGALPIAVKSPAL